jgi:hypothetical protein
MGIFLLADAVPVPDCSKRPHNRQGCCLLLLVYSLDESRVLTLVTEPVLGLRLALLLMEVTQAVVVERNSVSQALHRCIKEAGVSMIFHG